ncbi:SLBB domain-containing protein [Spirulina sp. CCNP1310]|uniref:SLBB domain-containing protein n=1 Tax=Spirulina sp. CCNP1310 TaxID=3110249 RepID=UPI002B1F2CE6|nr:SLBB domain-containing protein [Spirulina sp. CCNP1310]MEA5420871.1 SLBB domain-containing protein [Spirulina sp. CCNP1310]
MFILQSILNLPTVGLLTVMMMVIGANPGLAQTEPWTEPEGILWPASELPSNLTPLPDPPVSDYLLGGGDRLSIDVFEVPQYSGAYQVPIDGVLSLPLVGGISVAGLTISQASERISQAYNQFLKRPLITIRLINARPLNVVVGGEVKNPGTFTVNLIGGAGDSPGVQHPTLGTALKTAGGITLTADITQVQIRRRRRPEQGGDVVFTVNLQELIQRGDRTLDLSLRDGDTIFVPATETANLNQLRQLALFDFAADVNTGRTVSVVGEVQRPGSYNIIGTATVGGGATGLTGGLPTLTNALQQAGGIKPTADLRQIQIRRLTQGGNEQRFTLDLWALLQEGDVAQDTVLQEGDSIIVPIAANPSTADLTQIATAQFAPDTISVSVVGEVGNPGQFNVPPNTTLNQALMIAGGFNRDRAQRDALQLIRLNPDGTVTSRPVPVDLAQGVNETGNPILRDNDILVINRNRNTQLADRLSTTFNPAAGALALFSIPARIFGILESLGIINFSGDSQ